MSENFNLISLSDVSIAFDELISGSKSREEISDWAERMMNAQDERSLRYDPADLQPTIWKAVLYLLGVDLKDSPTSYQHTTEDFLKFRQELSI